METAISTHSPAATFKPRCVGLPLSWEAILIFLQRFFYSLMELTIHYKKQHYMPLYFIFYCGMTQLEAFLFWTRMWWNSVRLLCLGFFLPEQASFLSSGISKKARLRQSHLDIWFLKSCD